MLVRGLTRGRLTAPIASLVIAWVAWAPTAAADSAQPSDARTWLGGELDVLLAGTINVSAPGLTTSSDAATAVGLGGVLDFRATPWLTVGIAPRFVIGVKESGQNASSNQLDLRFRMTAGKEVAPRVRLYGIGALGYSFIFDIYTNPLNNNAYNSDGFIWSLGAGIAFALRPRLLLTGELSYQWGYQGGSVNGPFGFSYTDSDDFLTIGVGLMTAID